jgi:glycosyltransferase involved in cell wall biosynthesis
MHEKIPVTAIVLTYNEAANIERCIGGMDTIDEVILVDSHSSDDTVERARLARKDIRVFSNRFVDFGAQRNWALDNTSPKHEWILFMDADEYCTPELLQELAAFVSSPQHTAGAFIAGKTYFLGSWIKRCTLFPSYQLRLLRLGEVRYRKEGHGQREVTDKPLTYFKQAWIHDAFSKGLHQWIARHNQYSTEEVALIRRLRAENVEWSNVIDRDPIRRRRALKVLGASVPFRPISRFLYVYLWRRGCLDGRAGLIFCLLRLAHDIHIVAKLAEQNCMDTIERRPAANKSPEVAEMESRAAFLTVSGADRHAAHRESGSA